MRTLGYELNAGLQVLYVGMKPLSERDENSWLTGLENRHEHGSRNEATL